MKLVRFGLRLPAGLTQSARAELLDSGREPSDAAFPFGYKTTVGPAPEGRTSVRSRS